MSSHMGIIENQWELYVRLKFVLRFARVTTQLNHLSIPWNLWKTYAAND